LLALLWVVTVAGTLFVYILGLAKLRKAEVCGGRSAINKQCQSLGFMIVMPREAGPVVADW